MREKRKSGSCAHRVRALQGRLAKVTRERDWLLDRLQELAEMLDLVPGALILLEGGRQLVGQGQLQPLVFMLLQEERSQLEIKVDEERLREAM